MVSCRKIFLVTVRSIQLTCALFVIVFGAWTNHIITSLREHFDELLDKVPSEYSSLKDLVQNLFHMILQTPKRVWFALAAGVWAICAIIFVVLYKKYAKSASRAILIGVELITCLIMLGAFISITTFVVQILPMCIAVDMIPPLVAVVRVCPISKAWMAALALGLSLFIITLIGVIVQECWGGQRKREQAAAATATQMATTNYVSKGDHQYQVTTAEPMSPSTHQYQPQQSYFGQQQQANGEGYTSAGSPMYSTPVSTPGPYQGYAQIPPSHQYPRKPIQSNGYLPV